MKARWINQTDVCALSKQTGETVLVEGVLLFELLRMYQMWSPRCSDHSEQCPVDSLNASIDNKESNETGKESSKEANKESSNKEDHKDPDVDMQALPDSLLKQHLDVRSDANKTPLQNGFRATWWQVTLSAKLFKTTLAFFRNLKASKLSIANQAGSF